MSSDDWIEFSMHFIPVIAVYILCSFFKIIIELMFHQLIELLVEDCQLIGNEILDLSCNLGLKGFDIIALFPYVRDNDWLLDL